MSAKQHESLRVLSYNIHKGFSTGNRKFVLHQIREAIRSVRADLVFLQEVLGEHREHQKKYAAHWERDSQFEFLADEVWPHYAYGTNAIYTSGHHGNAILSRYPFTFFENIDISTNRMEKRGLLHGVIEVPHLKKPVHAICVHLGLFEADRAVQMRRICDRIESHVPHDEALIIAGDFNDWRVKLSRPLGSRLDVTEAFEELHQKHARTFPIWMPYLRLDRVYYRGLHARAARIMTGRPWTNLSDHAPLCVNLDLNS
jgi:endonuclease/exonuclease/phosphatase family metal-dependent hydrolase